jgi:hypothetical protein
MAVEIFSIDLPHEQWHRDHTVILINFTALGLWHNPVNPTMLFLLSQDWLLIMLSHSAHKPRVQRSHSGPQTEMFNCLIAVDCWVCYCNYQHDRWWKWMYIHTHSVSLGEKHRPPKILSRLPPKSVPLLVRAAFGGRRHRPSSHIWSIFDFPFVLSLSYTPGFNPPITCSLFNPLFPHVCLWVIVSM